jgi:FkbM family methyltransferase
MNAAALFIAHWLRPLRFRGKYRLLSPLFPSRGTVTPSVFGYPLALDISNHVDRSIFLGCFESLNTKRILRILRPGMTFFDVGANIGYFTLLAARCVGPSGTVHAFEPHPANAAVLRKALERNRLRQVRVWPIGLSDTKGVGWVAMPDQTIFPNRTASMIRSSGDGIEVPTRTLDDVAAECSIERIDFLKIDVDGFEEKVIHGAREMLRARRIRHLLVEFNPWFLERSGTDEKTLSTFLGEHGLRDVTHRVGVLDKLLGFGSDHHFALVEP